MWTPRAAADYCQELTRRSSSSFYYAFLFLDRERRDALHAVYAFCRLVDDAADDAATPAEARRLLDGWRRQLDAVYAPGDATPADPLHVVGADGGPSPAHAVTLALRAALRRFPLRREDLEAVIEGCAWDTERSRYATFDELLGYCQRVASAVGLLCIEIFGYATPRAREYARDLGVALQLTNILRDVDEDARRGRIYLPTEDLARFGVSEAELLDGRRDEAVLRLLRFQADRARGYYVRARAVLDGDERDRLVVAEIMGDIYRALLDELVRRDFPGRARASVPRRKKATIALGRFASARASGALRLALRTARRGMERLAS